MKHLNDLRFIFLDIKYGIQNLVKWFPIIWRDRDWDYVYLLIMLENKLNNMSEFHRYFGHSEDSVKHAKDLKTASFLARQIANEDYKEESFGDDYRLLDNSTPKVSKDGNITYPELTSIEREKVEMYYKEQEEYMERDIHLLFNLMKKELRNWWD